MSADGNHTTLGDLLRFATAVTGHVLRDEEHTALLTSGKIDTGRGDKYAYGFFESLEGSVRSVDLSRDAQTGWNGGGAASGPRLLRHQGETLPARGLAQPVVEAHEHLAV